MTAPTLQDLAPAGLDLAVDPYLVYAALRDKGPVHRIRVPEAGEVWLVVARDEARTALTDPRLRNDIRHSATWSDDGGHAIGRNMLQTDAPQHTRLRSLVAREFTAGRIEALRPRIQQIADQLLDAVPEDGRTDLVGGFALPLPMTVICELLGIPAADQGDFHTWSTEIVAPSSVEAAGAAVTGMTGYLGALVEERRRAPGADLLSALAAAPSPADGSPQAAEPALSTEELLGMAFLLLVAGHETTVNLISGSVLSLLTHPDQLAALRADPDLLGGAIEETLRYDGPVGATAFRYAAERLEIGGTVIPAGDSILVSLSAAARDPRHFADPDRFDIRREPRGHLGFGHGIHHCVGAPLARVEAAVALRTLLARFPRLTLDADPADLGRRTSTMLRGLRSLPVRLRP
ncbi:cytochrome P450 [Kitasatospora sp. NBC_00240]|uniref:cytochrome P450 family protein n=1 Tax=Kitasatospora sp. NBC_00240 TaxID=2903567 RepID=UPI00225C0434|nr:cytochrome P450 [Kitasatospora sp. NBC_00240]MCX5215076.1 cytochrome P450 [Kitasatospora sp. NBC_00240]